MSDIWSTIKEFYKTSFGFPEGLVELASVMDILLMCVSGSSNKTICEFFGYDEFYVKRILLEWLNFDGWEEDLDFNAYKAYLQGVNFGDNSLKGFSDYIIITNDWKAKEGALRVAFRICSQYYRYEDMINGQWY